MTKKKKDSTVIWWIGWITLTILSFFAACWFWTPIIAKHVGNMQQPHAPIIWVTAVFGTWMIILVPLIILMYNKVDKAYEDARITREAKQFTEQQKLFDVRCLDIPQEKRVLPKNITQKLKNFPEALPKGHFVDVILANGKKIPSVFIFNKKEILGIYDAKEMGFRGGDVRDIVLADPTTIRGFSEEKWLRLDGVGTSAA